MLRVVEYETRGRVDRRCSRICSGVGLLAGMELESFELRRPTDRTGQT